MEIKKIELPFRVKKPILALGSQSKNTVCFAKGNFAYLSPVYSDLNRPGDFLNFEKTVRYFTKKRPEIIAYDLHPEYQSTKYALILRPGAYRLRPAQHHHAHITCCMADNGLKNQKVIGVAFDGTGLGNDNTLWGAEFLICSYKNFKRRAHLKEIPLLGQERAIWEPFRLAVCWLYLIYKDRFLNLGIDFVKDIDKNKWRVLKKMYLAGFNSPLTTSMGRLFDAAASLVLAKQRVKFEAELAIELERLAAGYRIPDTAYGMQKAGYSFKIIKHNGEYIIDPSFMFKEIIADLKANVHRGKIAYIFHLTVAQMIRKTCLILRKETGINKIVLSGGVFQNKLLLRLSLDLLYKDGLNVFIPKNLSYNDSGISLGQAAIANFSRLAK